MSICDYISLALLGGFVVMAARHLWAQYCECGLWGQPGRPQPHRRQPRTRPRIHPRALSLILIGSCLVGVRVAAHYSERPTLDLLYPEPVGRQRSVIVTHPDQWILKGEFGAAAKCSCPHH